MQVTLEATGLDIARGASGEMGYIPVFLKEGKTEKSGLSISFFKPKVTDKDIIVFNRQLATLFSAGIPLLRGVQGLAEQMQNKTFKEVLLKVSADIQTGCSFSDALAKHPQSILGSLRKYGSGRRGIRYPGRHSRQACLTGRTCG